MITHIRLVFNKQTRDKRSSQYELEGERIVPIQLLHANIQLGYHYIAILSPNGDIVDSYMVTPQYYLQVQQLLHEKGLLIG